MLPLLARSSRSSSLLRKAVCLRTRATLGGRFLSVNSRSSSAASTSSSSSSSSPSSSSSSSSNPAVDEATRPTVDGLEQVIRKFMEQQKIPSSHLVISNPSSTKAKNSPHNNNNNGENEPALQQKAIENVLLACSLYDSYTFEEDGLLAEMLFSEHAELNLKKPPNIVRVSTCQEALQRLATGHYDMVISLFRLEGGLNIEAFMNAVEQVAPDTPLLHLALSPQELAHLDPRIDEKLRFSFRPIIQTSIEKQGPWRRPFLWNGDVSLFLAMIKSVEDRLNIAYDVASAPHEVKCIIVVEDSVQFYSSLLPTLYREILKQIHVRNEDVSDPKMKLDRIKKRPKVLLATSYEEALQLYNKFTDNVMGVITDAGFPRNNIHDKTAGVHLATEIRRRTPEVPILIQSSDKSISAHANRLGVEFIHKSSSALNFELRNFIDDNLGFGDFRFRDTHQGPVLARAANLKSLVEVLGQVNDASVVFHGQHNHFSMWLSARGYFDLANSIRGIAIPETLPVAEAAQWVRQALQHRIQRYLHQSVTEFDPSVLQWTSRIARIGKGSLGGKGRGFRFLNSVLERYDVENLIPGLRVIIPRSLIIAASEFDTFVNDTGLAVRALEKKTDEEVARLFLDAELPSELVSKLSHHLAIFKNPIAVRSSSLFEDAFQQPFAGVYSTYMLPNNDSDVNVRLKDLVNAVKLVYASTFFMGARSYAEATHHRIEEEKMAVIIQEVSGEKRDNLFFPAVSGVAVGIDYYPLPNTSQNDGSCSLAPGLGASVVDGMSNIRFSLGDNKTPTGLANEENIEMFALDLSVKSDWLQDWNGQRNRVSIPLEYARSLGAYDAAGVVKSVPLAPIAIETEDVHGVKRVLNVEPAPPVPEPTMRPTSLRQIIAGELFPFSDVIHFLLKLGSAGLACPVEIEFAVTLSHVPNQPSEFTILQIRPMATIDPARPTMMFSTLPSSDAAVVRSARALGHGSFQNLSDIVYVKPASFSREHTHKIAEEIERVNQHLREEDRQYVLIGPGRWGTHDPRNGIPVDWPQINSARFMVETSIHGSNVAPSQGAHFFQNVISFGIGYLTVDDASAESQELVDFDWLDAQPEAEGSKNLQFVRHVRFENPLEVVVDCRSQCGVIMKPDKPFATFVGQFDAFLNIEALQ